MAKRKSTKAQQQAVQAQEVQEVAQETVETATEVVDEQEQKYDLEEVPEWVQKVPEGTALAMPTDVKTNDSGMPLLIITIVDKREKARRRGWDEISEISICPFRGYSFGVGYSSEGGSTLGGSTVVGLGNVVSAAELYDGSQRLFNDAVCRSNVRWGADGSASKIILKGLLCEAIMSWLNNSYGHKIVFDPADLYGGIIDNFLGKVLEWLEHYRVTTAREVKHEDVIRDLNDKIAALSAKNAELEAEIADLNEKIVKQSSENIDHMELEKELKNEILRYKAAAAFSQVTIEELDKERRQIPSAKKELKKSIQRVLLKYNK